MVLAGTRWLKIKSLLASIHLVDPCNPHFPAERPAELDMPALKGFDFAGRIPAWHGGGCTQVNHRFGSHPLFPAL